jgi:hypothetical protein
MADFEDIRRPEVGSMSDLPAITNDKLTRFDNEASNSNLAAHNALLSEDSSQIIDRFNTSSQQLEGSESMEGTVNEMFSPAWNLEMMANQAELSSILQDPNVSDEDKEVFAQGFLNLQSRSIQNERDMLGTKALGQDVLGETQGEELVRVDLSDNLRQIYELKAEQQSLLNAEIASNDLRLWAQWQDILESVFVPFREQVAVSRMLNEIKEVNEGEGSHFLKAFWALGEAKLDVRKSLEAMNAEQRLELTRKLVDYSREASSIPLFNDSNDYVKTDLLRVALEDGYIDNTSRWIDNVVAVLDLYYIGRVAHKGVGFLSSLKRGGVVGELADVRDAQRQAMATKISHNSPSQTVKDVNSDVNAIMHEAAMADSTDDTAKALYGGTKADVAVHDLLPKMENIGAWVEDVPVGLDRLGNAKLSVPAEVMDILKNRTTNEFTDSELLSARNHITESFRNINGAFYYQAQSAIKTAPNGDVLIDAVYGPRGRGYQSVEEARDQAEFLFRDYEVDVGDIKLLSSENGRSFTLDWDEAKAFEEMAEVDPSLFKPNYLLKVETKITPGAAHVRKGDFSEVDTRSLGPTNLFTKLRQGSITRFGLDPASIFPKHFSQGVASHIFNGAQMEKQLQGLTLDFAKKYGELGKVEKQAASHMINWANHNRKWFNNSTLMAEGIPPNVIDTLNTFKRISDANYYLENLNLSNKFKSRGFKWFVDRANNSSQAVKPLSEDAVLSKMKSSGFFRQVYDPDTNSIIEMTVDEVVQLYKSEGKIAKMSSPVDVDGVVADAVVVKDRAGSSFLKELNGDTQVLNYIPGYFPVRYKHPHYVVKRWKDASGKEITKAVSNVATISEAKSVARSKNIDAEKGVEYFYRPARELQRSRSFDPVFGSTDDLDLEVMSSSGRLAHMHRGKLLEGSDAKNYSPTGSHLHDPVEALATQMRSITNRLNMGEAIGNIKTRALDAYSDLLPKNHWGESVWTSDVTEVIAKEGSLNNKRVRDLRNQIEYVNFLEDGYINAIDEGWKAGLQIISTVLGNRDFATLEKAFMWMADARGPTAAVRATAFQAYIATSPIRSFLINSHQAVQLAANHTKWMGSRAVPEMTYMILRQLREGDSFLAKGTAQLNKHLRAEDVFLKSLGMTKAQGEEMFKQFSQSGMIANITKHDLLRGSFKDLADNIIAANAGGPLGKAWHKSTSPLRLLRRLGFDSGEYINVLSSWLAHRDAKVREMLKDGTAKSRSSASDMVHSDKNTMDLVRTEAANYTYNMHRGGEMAWQSNSFALLGQFLSAPWKAALTMTTNRGLTKMQKFRLMAFNGVMYTLPPALLINLFDEAGIDLPEDDQLRTDLLNGFEGLIFNRLASAMYGEPVMTDWSGLAPWDVHGVLDMYLAIGLTDPATAMIESPGGKLFIGDNAKIGEFIRAAGQMTNFIEDPGRPTKFHHVMKEFLEISSGMSNAFKAEAAWKSGQYQSNSGNILAEDLNAIESLNIMLGMPPMRATEGFWVNEKAYELTKEFEDDIGTWYNDYKKELAREGINPRESGYIQEVFSAFWTVMNDNPRRAMKARKSLERLILRDVANNDTRFIKHIIRMWPVATETELRNMITASPKLSKPQKDNLIKLIDMSFDIVEEE